MIGQAPQEQTQPSPDDLPRLMEAYAKHGDLATLFQIHEMNQMRQAAQRNLAMGNNVPQETIMAREVEAYQNGGIRDLAQRVGGAAQHQSQQAQQNMNNVAQAGLPSQPTPDVAQAAYSGGGIVAFAGPEGSVVPEVDDSSVRQKFWSWVASLGVDAASLAGPQFDKLREKYLEMGGDLGAKVEEALSSAPTMAEIGDSMPRSDLGGQQRLDLSPVTSAITDTANGAMDATQEFLAGIGDTNSVAGQQGSVLEGVLKGVPGLMADGLSGMLPTPEPNAELADMGGAPGSNGAQPPQPPQPPREAMKSPSMPETGIGAVLSKLFSPSSAQSAANRTRDSRVENAAAKGQAHTEFDFNPPYDPNAAPAQEVEQAAAAQTPPPEGIAAVQGAAPTASPQMNPETLADINQKIQGAAPAYDPMKGVEAIANPDLRAAIENKASPTAGPQIDPRSPDTRGIASTVQKTPEQLAQERYNAAIGKAEDPKKLAMDKLIATLAGGVGVAGQESGVGASGARMAMAGKAEGDSQQARQIARRKEELEYERGVAREDSVRKDEHANELERIGVDGATRLSVQQAANRSREATQELMNSGNLDRSKVDARSRMDVADVNNAASYERMAKEYGFRESMAITEANSDRFEAITASLVGDPTYQEGLEEALAGYDRSFMRNDRPWVGKSGVAQPTRMDAHATFTREYIERILKLSGNGSSTPSAASGPVDAAAYFQ